MAPIYGVTWLVLDQIKGLGPTSGWEDGHAPGTRQSAIDEDWLR